MLTRRLTIVAATLILTLIGATAGTLPAAQATVADYLIDANKQGSAAARNQGGGGEAAADPICYFDGAVIDCQGPNGGWWNGTCWEAVWADSPDNAIWGPGDPGDRPWAGAQGETNLWLTMAPGGMATTSGVIIQCLTPGGHYTYYWRESAAPPPTAAQLEEAARLLLEGVVESPGIGVYPGFIDGTDPEATGIVGWPTWLWADNPGPAVGQPETKETSVGGYTLRATARLVDIVYDTGDGHQVTCGLGAAPTGVDLTDPADPPPACGWTYTQRGHYTITATTHVVVDWAGAGKAGQIPIEVTASGRYDVAEIQVLIVPNR